MDLLKSSGTVAASILDCEPCEGPVGVTDIEPSQDHVGVPDSHSPVSNF